MLTTVSTLLSLVELADNGIMKYYFNELVLHPKIVELVEICLHALQGANCTYALHLHPKISHMPYNYATALIICLYGIWLTPEPNLN